MVFVWNLLVRPLGGIWDIYDCSRHLSLLPVHCSGSLLSPKPSEEIGREFEEVKAMGRNKQDLIQAAVAETVALFFVRAAGKAGRPKSGFGLMRLSMDGDVIDIEKTKEIADRFMKQISIFWHSIRL